MKKHILYTDTVTFLAFFGYTKNNININFFIRQIYIKYDFGMIYDDIYRFQYDAHCKLYILHYNLVNIFMQTRCCDLTTDVWSAYITHDLKYAIQPWVSGWIKRKLTIYYMVIPLRVTRKNFQFCIYYTWLVPILLSSIWFRCTV